jgi:hypothetical protein
MNPEGAASAIAAKTAPRPRRDFHRLMDWGGRDQGQVQQLPGVRRCDHSTQGRQDREQARDGDGVNARLMIRSLCGTL